MQNVLVYVSINFEWLPIVTIYLYSHDATANFQGSSTLRRRNLKTQQTPEILDLCLRKSLSEKLHNHRNVIIFEKSGPFLNVKW